MVSKTPHQVRDYVNQYIEADGGLDFVNIPYVTADDKSVQGFGYFVKDFDKTHVQITQWPSMNRGGHTSAVYGGTGGGITAYAIASNWDKNGHCQIVSQSSPSQNDIGIRKAQNIFFQGAEYHPDSSQLLKSIEEGPFILTLAKPTLDNFITPLHFVAFYFDGKRSFCIPPGVFYQGPFPATNSGLKIFTKHGKIHGIIHCDFLKEFGLLATFGDAFSVPKLELSKTKFSKIESDITVLEDQYWIKNSNEQIKFREQNIAIIQEMVQHLKPIKVHLCKESLLKPYGCTVPTSMDPMEIPLEVVAWPNFKGRPVERGNEAGLTTNRFIIDWEHKPHEPSELTLCSPPEVKGGGAFLSYSDSEIDGRKDVSIHVTDMWSRPDGSQLIMPVQSQSFIILLANNHKDTNTPDLRTLTALAIQQDKGLVLKPGVWCSRPLPPSIGTCKFVGRSSAVNAHFYLDTRDDWGLGLAINITIPHHQLLPIRFEPGPVHKSLSG